MSILVLQIIIKQWDKSQRTEAHQKLRANIPDEYPIICPPALSVFGQDCVIDQHGDDIQGNRVKYIKDTEGNLKFDRFLISEDYQHIDYLGYPPKETPARIGSVNNQWIQCKYNCRYSIFESDMYYWLYEDVIVNAICLSQFDENIFLKTEPGILYEDYHDLDKRKKR